MNMAALKMVLEKLADHCQDDMADKIGAPEDKLTEALEDASGEDQDQDEEMGEEHAPEMVVDEEEQDPIKAHLKSFMRPKVAPSKPGTAVMIAMEKRKPMAGKKSIKDLMHG